MAASPLLALCLVTLWRFTFCAVTPAGEERPPRIVEHPSDTVVPRGSPATLNCRAEGSPQPRIYWLKDGKKVKLAPTLLIMPTGSLFLLVVLQADAGRYRCVAVNSAGKTMSRVATLSGAVLREEFRVSPADTDVSVGSKVTLRCSPPKGDPPPVVGWKRNGRQIDFNTPDSRYSMAGEGDLVITNVTLRDTGSYACVARNYAGMKRRSRPAWLTVNELPPPPSNVTVIPVDESSALVTWESTDDLDLTSLRPDGYQVYARSEEAHSQKLRADVNSTQVTLSNLTAGANYTVWVTSLSPSGESAPSPPVDLQLPHPLSTADETPVPKQSHFPSVALHLPSPIADVTPEPEQHRRDSSVADPAADPSTDPAGGQRRPPPGHIWLAAAVSALVLLTLTGLAISGWVRHLRSKQSTGAADEKRRDGVSLLPSSVRPASWMEGGVWSAELAGRRTELGGPQPAPSAADGGERMGRGAAPSPYATTALLQSGPEDSWMDSCRKSREITTSSFIAPVTSASSRSSSQSAVYSRPHRSPCGEDVSSPDPRCRGDGGTAGLAITPCCPPSDCQPSTRTSGDGSWPCSGRQRDPRDFGQPLLAGVPYRGGEASAGESRHLSFIGGVVTGDRGDICRAEGDDVCRRALSTDSPECNRPTSMRY